MPPRLLWQEAHAPIRSSKYGTGMNHRAEQVGSLLRSVEAEVSELKADPVSNFVALPSHRAADFLRLFR